jgi:uncharacterized protein YdaU (DUF1376 family)
MTKRRPWYPFHFEDYDRDTKHLSDAADLLYRRLLTALWDNGGFLPLDFELLGQKVRKRPSFVRRYFEGELAQYFTVMGAEFYQKRMLDEVNKAEQISQKRHEAAKKRFDE